MAAEVELVIGLVEISEAGHNFGFIIPFESGARGDVENTVGAVAEIRRIAATLSFQRVNIFWIDLRAEVAGDVGVGDRNTVDEPTDLVAAANVELIVSEVRAGNVVGDHREAVGARGAWSVLNFRTVDKAGGSGRGGLCRGGIRGHSYGLSLRSQVQLEMQNRSRAGEHGYVLLLRGERRAGNADGIVSERDSIEMKLAVPIGLGGPGVIRSFGPQDDLSVRDRAVLWIVNDAADGAEDRGERSGGDKKENCERAGAAHEIRFSLK